MRVSLRVAFVAAALAALPTGLPADSQESGTPGSGPAATSNKLSVSIDAGKLKDLLSNRKQQKESVALEITWPLLAADGLLVEDPPSRLVGPISNDEFAKGLDASPVLQALEKEIDAEPTALQLALGGVAPAQARLLLYARAQVWALLHAKGVTFDVKHNDASVVDPRFAYGVDWYFLGHTLPGPVPTGARIWTVYAHTRGMYVKLPPMPDAEHPTIELVVTGALEPIIEISQGKVTVKTEGMPLPEGLKDAATGVDFSFPQSGSLGLAIGALQLDQRARKGLDAFFRDSTYISGVLLGHEADAYYGLRGEIMKGPVDLTVGLTANGSDPVFGLGTTVGNGVGVFAGVRQMEGDGTDKRNRFVGGLSYAIGTDPRVEGRKIEVDVRSQPQEAHATRYPPKLAEGWSGVYGRVLCDPFDARANEIVRGIGTGGYQIDLLVNKAASGFLRGQTYGETTWYFSASIPAGVVYKDTAITDLTSSPPQARKDYAVVSLEGGAVQFESKPNEFTRMDVVVVKRQ